MPEFKHQQGPQLLSVIGHAALVLIQQASDILGIEDPRASHSLRRQKIPCQRAQFSLEPLSDRYSKPFLPSARHKWRQKILNGALQDVFSLATSQLVIRG